MDKYNKTPIGRAHNLISAYNQTDKKYKLGKGDLTAKWIVENIFSKPCAHCGESDWYKIGCNRLDNSKPHTMDNVEPCCSKCNKKLPRNKPSKVHKKLNEFLRTKLSQMMVKYCDIYPSIPKAIEIIC